MATRQFIDRGGNEAEYRIYQALYKTGRKEPQDFAFRPGGRNGLSFAVYSPVVGIWVGETTPALELQFRAAAQHIEVISEREAISDASGELARALGG